VTDAAERPDAHADPAELLALAVDLTHRAGAMLLEGLDRVRSSVETKSSSTDMVTEMDQASEALIVEGILAARPDDGILGEEGTERPGTSGVRWVIDPVDGTTNYLYRIAGFAVSIGIERVHPGSGATTVAGVVHDPVHADTFAATAGGGATRNGRPIACSPEADLQRALVATGFSYIPDIRRDQASVLVDVLPRVRDIRRFGAAAVDLCSVACGRVDAYFELGLAPWDLAAGALVAREAGVVVTDLQGGATDGAFVVAAPPALAEPLRALLRGAGARPVPR
jgi:myo-inositol-1(or 4)-monophosphatase